MRKPLLFIASICLLATTIPAQAVVVNGGYETGILSGWSSIGAAHVDTAVIGVAPTQGTFHAYIDNTGNFAAPIATVVPFLGVPGSSILGLGAGPPTTGSAIKQSVTVSAGDVLSFDWNFLTDEWNEAPTFNDFAIFSVDTVPNFLASRNSTFSTLNLLSPPAGFDGQTNYATQTYTFPSAGTFTLSFAVFNVGDAGHNSVLLVDAVSISVVPEPASLGLLGAGAMLAKRRRKV